MFTCKGENRLAKAYLQSHIDENLLKVFKAMAFEKFEGKRGFVSMATEDALKAWMAQNTKREYIQTDKGRMGPFLLGVNKMLAKSGNQESQKLLDELGIPY